MGKIIIKNGLFSFEEIKNYIPTLLNDYEQDTLKFCHEWLNGKEQFLLYTSGSTGAPKPLYLSRKQLTASALSTAKALHLQKGDNALVCLNTKYIAGIMMLVRAMVVDMNIVLVPPNTSPLKEIPATLTIDFAAFVPLQLQKTLENSTPFEHSILNGMKAIIIGGAPITVELEEKIQIITAPLYATFGMTETVSHIALKRLNGREKQAYYQVLPSVSIATDNRGCLKVKAEVTDHQWIQTNDLVTLLSADTFCWLGRADNTINTGGIKLQPEKIESAIEALLLTNGIKYYFIAALPHPVLGEAVTLFIEKENDRDLLLLEKISPYLTKFEIPKALIYVDFFPKSDTGKIDKKSLINQYKNHFIN